MASASGLRDFVINSRKRLVEGREQLRQLHDAGTSGRQIVSGMSDLTDDIIRQLLSNLIAEIHGPHSPDEDSGFESQFTLILHGGTGRRDMAPFSDVDMMLLYRQTADSEIQELANRIARDIFDIGFKLGHSVRTPREAWSMAVKDPEVFSSMAEARYIGGNLELYQHFVNRMRRIAAKNSTALVRSICNARQQERVQFGETVYVLRPNIKKSRGGMRDVHLIRWLGFAKYGETDIDQLCRKNAIIERDAMRVNAAYEFLMKIRNEMHFHAGRASDELGKPEQVRIAEKFGYQGSDGVLPVEEFMRDYFDHTTDIRHISDQFVASIRSRRSFANLLAPLITKNVEDHFQLGPHHVGINSTELANSSSDIEQILQLVQLSNVHGVDIEQETWETIRRTMIDQPTISLTVTAAEQFYALFSDSEKIGRSLRKLHEMRVLERILPEVNHARNLVQFNEYHQYTVDEHSLRAVEIGAGFQRDKGRIGKVYRALREKNLLHLALLIHDLGKGFSEDHSEVGRRLADAIGKRLQLPVDDVEDLKFLVHNHLMMSNVALRRDINDESLVAEFAANVGSVKVLKLLFLLTCADISAVGPGVFNQWKKELLTDLYFNAKNVLTGHHGIDGVDLTLEERYKDIGEQIEDLEVRRWIVQQARNLPRNYCRLIPGELIAEQLMSIRDTIGDEVQCWVNPSKDGLIDICVGKREKRRSGIFYKTTGMLASNGLRILTADIKHLSNSLVWYWFRVRDIDYEQTPGLRLEEIAETVKGIATGKVRENTSFRRVWRKENEFINPRQKIRVQLDNQTVQTATVIDVFAFRKFGLLYTISKAIFNLKLDVRFARISTYGNRVVNVFYVTDDQGNKIRDLKRLDEIRATLLATAQQYLQVTGEQLTNNE